MEKRELKFYEAPAMEIVEVEAKLALLAGSPDDPFDPGNQGPSNDF